MTCEGCDRAGCPRWLRSQTPMPDFVRAAFARMLEDANANPPRPLRSVDKQIAEKHAKVGIAADRDCAAHAVNWRDLAIAGRAREAALTAEVERLRGILEPKPHESLEMAALRAVGDARTLPILDRAFVVLGGCGFENTEDAARRVMGDLAAARADAANARLIATEAIEIADSLVTIAKRGYVLRGRVANLATLRARLTSPEPAKEN